VFFDKYVADVMKKFRRAFKQCLSEEYDCSTYKQCATGLRL